jgi:hypothetical protein
MATEIPAAWYPDPAGGAALRWWDGTGWTDYLKAPEPFPPTAQPQSRRQAQAQYSEQLANHDQPLYAASAAPIPQASYQAQPLHYAQTQVLDHPHPEAQPHSTAPVVIPQETRYSNYVPMQSKPYEQVAKARKLEPFIVYTPEAWFIATSPAWALVVGMILSAVMTSGSPGYIGFSAGGFVTSIVLAITDRRKLLADGYESAPSAWWMLLSPLAYLISRGIHVSREKGKGWAPLVVYIVLCVFLSAAAIVFVLLFAQYLLVQAPSAGLG